MTRAVELSCYVALLLPRGSVGRPEGSAVFEAGATLRIPQRSEIPSAVDQAQDVYVSLADLIDQPIAPDHQLSHRRLIELGHYASTLGQLR